MCFLFFEALGNVRVNSSVIHSYDIIIMKHLFPDCLNVSALEKINPNLFCLALDCLGLRAAAAAAAL